MSTSRYASLVDMYMGASKLIDADLLSEGELMTHIGKAATNERVVAKIAPLEGQAKDVVHAERSFVAGTAKFMANAVNVLREGRAADAVSLDKYLAAEVINSFSSIMGAGTAYVIVTEREKLLRSEDETAKKYMWNQWIVGISNGQLSLLATDKVYQK